MATTEAPRRSRERVALFALGALALVAGACVLISYLNRPSQMGTSEEAFNTVDALYTAVRNRDEKRVSECERRLAGYREAGKLPADAADELGAIIQKAKSGSWDTATERLYDFMRAQQRAGALEPRERDTKAKSGKGKGK